MVVETIFFAIGFCVGVFFSGVVIWYLVRGME